MAEVNALDCVFRFLVTFCFSFLIVVVSRHVCPVCPDSRNLLLPGLVGNVALYITDKLGMSLHDCIKRTKIKRKNEPNYTIKALQSLKYLEILNISQAQIGPTD